MDQQQVEELTTNPTESLAFEIKTWIDPDSPEGQAKVVKSCIALRNNDGGALLIGFNNQTGAPDPNTLLQDVKASFHIDKIQAMVAKHASEPFEIELHFIERDGQPYPLAVPGGIKSPVAARSPITDAQNNVSSPNIASTFDRCSQTIRRQLQKPRGGIGRWLLAAASRIAKRTSVASSGGI